MREQKETSESVSKVSYWVISAGKGCYVSTSPYYTYTDDLKHAVKYETYEAALAECEKREEPAEINRNDSKYSTPDERHKVETT
jgi:hypothetical protein